jgi:hypothetical protein
MNAKGPWPTECVTASRTGPSEHSNALSSTEGSLIPACVMVTRLTVPLVALQVSIAQSVRFVLHSTPARTLTSVPWMKLGAMPRTGEGALYHTAVTLYTVLLAFKRPPTVVLDADAVAERVAASVPVTVSLGVRERLSDDVRDFVNDSVTERVNERVHVLLRDADVVRVRVIVRVFREMETVWEVDTEPVWVAFTEVVIDRPRDRDADVVREIVMDSVGVADAVIDGVSVWVDDLVVV